MEWIRLLLLEFLERAYFEVLMAGSLGQQKFEFADRSTSKLTALVLPVASLHWSSHICKLCLCGCQQTPPKCKCSESGQRRTMTEVNGQDQQGPAVSARRWKWFSWVLIWMLSYDLGNLQPCGLLTRSNLSSQAELPLLVTGTWSQLIKNHHFNPQSERATVVLGRNTNFQLHILIWGIERTL